jgi:hypothetical protein
MTLGSIFSKLSGITLRNIAKWYGVGVLVILVLIVAGFFAAVVAQILWAIITALGFWGTVVVLAIIVAFISVNHFKDEIFPEEDFWERKQREVLLHGTTRHPTVRTTENKSDLYNFSRMADDQTWLRVEEAITGIKDGETCDIHAPDGTVHHCADKYEALKVCEELWGARKTE